MVICVHAAYAAFRVTKHTDDTLLRNAYDRLLSDASSLNEEQQRSNS
jgi:hypothetical protein